MNTKTIPYLAAGLALVSGLSYAAPEVADSADAVKPLAYGAQVPDADLTAIDGETISLRDALGGGRSVLIFFRGGWCPYCTRHLAGLESVEGDLTALGYKIIAISPDRIESVKKADAEQNFGYTLLSDLKMEAITRFGLAFEVDADTLKRYQGYGIDLLSAPDSDAKLLPVPAVYIVDAGGTIRFMHMNPDYKQRLDPLAVLAAAQAAKDAEIDTPLREDTVDYRQGDTVLEGFVARPENGGQPLPAVVVFHAWRGLGDYERRRARQLAELGYVAFAADVYGKGVRAESRKEAAALARTYKKDRALMRRRVRAALEAARAQPGVDADRVAAIGYCFGGTCALELARSGAELAGVVSFHGGLDRAPGLENEPIRTRVLVCHGGSDPHVPAEDVAALEKELTDAGVDWQLIAYGHAVHSFTEPASGPNTGGGAAYDPLADVRSWEDMQAFFRRILR
jgi:dienelactone hydrolase/peroxiredoxin